MSGESRALAAVEKINAWIRAKTANDPTRIYNVYKLNGKGIRKRTGNELAFVAPMGVGAVVDARNQTWSGT